MLRVRNMRALHSAGCLSSMRQVASIRTRNATRYTNAKNTTDEAEADIPSLLDKHIDGSRMEEQREQTSEGTRFTGGWMRHDWASHTCAHHLAVLTCPTLSRTTAPKLLRETAGYLRAGAQRWGRRGRACG